MPLPTFISASSEPPTLANSEPTPLCGSGNPKSPVSNPRTADQAGSCLETDDKASPSQLNLGLVKSLEDPSIVEYIEKYNKYEADYVRRIKAKYFSKKGLNGGNIFEKETPIDNEIIKSSMWPCTKSYTESVRIFEDQNKSLTSTPDTSRNTPNKKPQCKKSS